MDKEFQKLLEGAEGRSDYIIAVCVDIRDFTPFCKRVDSFLTGIYIKKVYLKIINGYFKDATFYKPAGDGLLIAIRCKEEDMKAIAKSTLDSCLRLVEDFGSLLHGEPMINFPTPEKIGIGITRGNACCLHSGGEILDYSGRTLNLASRLMDMARPSGIVLDGSFGLDLLSEKMKEQFSKEMVYVRGIAELSQIKVYCTKKYTLIPDAFKRPLKEPKWTTVKEKIIFGEFKALAGPSFDIDLRKRPLYKDKITVRIRYENPKIEGFTRCFDYYIHEEEVSLLQIGKKSFIRLKHSSIVEEIEKDQVEDDAEIEILVIYPIER